MLVWKIILICRDFTRRGIQLGWCENLQLVCLSITVWLFTCLCLNKLWMIGISQMFTVILYQASPGLLNLPTSLVWE